MTVRRAGTFPSATIDQEMAKLHYEVGRTLSIWAGVELQVRQTFRIALGGWLETPAHAVFRAAVNLNARLGMANEAVTFALERAGNIILQEQWTKLYTRTRKQAGSRNKVAHGQVVAITGPTDEHGASYTIGARVIDPMDPKLLDLSPQRQLAEGLSAVQLRDMQARFITLGHDLFLHGQEFEKLMRKAMAAPDYLKR